MNPNTAAVPISEEAGIGLIEVVVSMFILALIALSILPLLAQGLTQSAKNSSIASATQFVSERLDFPRGVTDTCASVAGRAGTETRADARGNPLTLVSVAGACPTSYPGTVSFTTTATRTGTTTALASATILVYVAGA